MRGLRDCAYVSMKFSRVIKHCPRQFSHQVMWIWPIKKLWCQTMVSSRIYENGSNVAGKLILCFTAVCQICQIPLCTSLKVANLTWISKLYDIYHLLQYLYIKMPSKVKLPINGRINLRLFTVLLVHLLSSIRSHWPLYARGSSWNREKMTIRKERVLFSVKGPSYIYF